MSTITLKQWGKLTAVIKSLKGSEESICELTADMLNNEKTASRRTEKLLHIASKIAEIANDLKSINETSTLQP